MASAKDVKYRARITYYEDGKQVAWSKVKTAREGDSVAAHPVFKFGTRISIPALKGIVGDGEYVVHDRGPAVTKAVASGGKGYVFDVYVKSSARVRSLAKSVPMYMDVIVHQ